MARRAAGFAAIAAQTSWRDCAKARAMMTADAKPRATK
jgi:hypothetical protein